MRMRCVAAVPAALLLPLFTLSLPAQHPIRVVRHSPVDTARSGDVVTISFDRPVVGSLERTPDPTRLVRVEPPLDAHIDWRDPATLRIIPREALVPGQRYQFTLSDDFTAMDGGALEAPYQFTVLTRGPTLLGSIPSLHTRYAATLEPSGRIRLVYSSAVDTSQLGRTARLELSANDGSCRPRVIRYAVRSTREITESDDWSVRAAGGWEQDSLARQFRRVIEIRPLTPLPEGCAGTIVLPSFNPFDRAEIRYPMATAPGFAIGGLECPDRDCAAGQYLILTFAAPVYRDSLVPRLHLEPAVPYTLSSADGPTGRWTLRLRILPRTTYGIRVDSSLTDMYGRRLTGNRTVSRFTSDRRSALGHELGFFTVSRSRPVLRITHVNVDSAELVIVPIPDSLRTMVLGLPNDPDSVARMVARLRDTVIRGVSLRAPFNTERITDVELSPSALGGRGGSLFAIRARSVAVTRRPPSPPPARIITRDGVETIEIIGEDALSIRTAIVQLTDLIAHAKVSSGSGAVLVTNGTTGRPVRGARVTTRGDDDRVLAVGETDATGVATLAPTGVPDRVTRAEPVAGRSSAAVAPNADVRLIEVTKGDDRSLTPNVIKWWMPRYAVDNLGGSFVRAKLAHASVFADRAIYRPGEVVYLTTILRLGPLSELTVPARGDSVRVRVSHFEPGERARRTVRDTVLRLNDFGSAADSFVIGRARTLGWYAIAVDRYANGWQAAGSSGFQLAEYRTPEFETSLTLDTTVRFLGDTLRGQLRARYYFGAPMARAVVRWSALTEDDDAGFTVPGLPHGFTIGESGQVGDATYRRDDTVNGVDTLAADGTLSLRIPTSAGKSTSPVRVDVEIAVDDLNRRSVGAEKSTFMHPTSFYIATRDSARGSWYWTENAPRRFDVLAVRPDGRRVTAVRVAVVVARRRPHFTPSTDGSAPTVKWTMDTVMRDSLVTRDSPARYAFIPRTPGWYALTFSTTDDRGRPVITSVGGYVVGRDWTPWTDTPVRIAMRVDRDSLAPGDTVIVRFVSPFPSAEAWVTVEREAVLAQRRLRVAAGESTVRIPVTERFVPGAQVSVLLVDSGATWRTDSTHRRIRAGYASITVDRSARALSVEVRPEQPEYIPGDSARVTVRVRDHRSTPVRAHVTLWAVDEGVLALTDYSRPDPLAELYASNGTGLQFVSTAWSIASLGRLLTPFGWRKTYFGSRAGNSLVSIATQSAALGVTVAGTGSLLRSDFRSTAFYVASLVTDAEGRAVASVKLPDNLTTYRVFAVAVTADDQYGSGESSILLTKPLLARASLPRFLRTGDAMLAGAVINNRTGDTVSVNVRAGGLRIEATAETTATRTLAKNAGVEVRFNWRTAAPAGDSAVFRFDVAGGGNADAVQVSVPVRPPYSPRYHAVSGVARDQSTIRMWLPRDIDPRRSRLTLRVGASPVPLIRAAYARMEVYPYYCTEQLTSIGRVIMAMLRLQRAGVLDSTAAPDARTLRGRLQYVVDEIVRRQRDSGGIGYWGSDTWTDPWLGAYAGTLLVDAREAGFGVDSVVIAKIAQSVKIDPDTSSWVHEDRYGTRSQRERATAWRLSQDLAVLHFLRRAGVGDTELEDRMIDLAPRMVWEDRVWLAELLAKREDQAAARAQLARVWRDVETAGIRVDIPDSLLVTLGFRSHVRPVARLLRATMAIDRGHPKLAALVERMVQQGRAEWGWVWNTQDYAVLATALADLAISQKQSSVNATVSVRSARAATNDRLLLSASSAVSADSAVVLDGLLERDGEWMTLPVRIESKGGPVFYVLTVDEVPLAPPTTPDAKGMIVERWYERFDDGRAVTDVKEGDLVRGRLRITVPSDREFVAVEDLLPAGLEVVDLSLRTSTLGPFESEGSANAARAGDRANSGAWSLPWLYGSWAGGWWSPWEHKEVRDDRVMYFARVLWKGTYTASYVARATTAGTFVRPPAHAEEMYNPSVGGRSDGGTFRVLPKE